VIDCEGRSTSLLFFCFGFRRSRIGTLRTLRALRHLPICEPSEPSVDSTIVTERFAVCIQLVRGIIIGIARSISRSFAAGELGSAPRAAKNGAATGPDRSGPFAAISRNGGRSRSGELLFRLPGPRHGSFLQKPIQLSVTPRSAGRRVSERPLLSPEICSPATPHRALSSDPYSTSPSCVGGRRTPRARALSPFSIPRADVICRTVYPGIRGKSRVSSSTNRIAVYEPHAPTPAVSLFLSAKSRDSFRWLYRRSHARREPAKVRTGRESRKKRAIEPRGKEREASE